MLVLAAVLVLGVSAFMVSALNKAPSEATVNRHYNARVLQQAKEALVGYVAKEVLDLSEDIPGRLPCPESPGDAGGDFEGAIAVDPGIVRDMLGPDRKPQGVTIRIGATDGAQTEVISGLDAGREVWLCFANGRQAGELQMRLGTSHQMRRTVGHLYGLPDLLEEHFSRLVDYQFTAGMEDELDSISRGELEHVEYLRRFYFGNGEPGLKELLENKSEEVDARDVCTIEIGVPEGEDPVVVRVGRYGPYVQLGEDEDEGGKPKRSSVWPTIDPDAVTLSDGHLVRLWVLVLDDEPHDDGPCDELFPARHAVEGIAVEEQEVDLAGHLPQRRQPLLDVRCDGGEALSIPAVGQLGAGGRRLPV